MRFVILFAFLMSASSVMADDLRPFVRGSWQELREANIGKHMVVHMWGLTCAPCLVEMPRWGELLRDHADARLVMIAADPVAQESERLSATLAQAGLNEADNWVFADDFGERLRYEIDPRWRGELPRTLLIAANGETTVLSGVADMNVIIDWIAAQKN